MSNSETERRREAWAQAWARRAAREGGISSDSKTSGIHLKQVIKIEVSRQVNEALKQIRENILAEVRGMVKSSVEGKVNSYCESVFCVLQEDPEEDEHFQYIASPPELKRHHGTEQDL